MTSPTICPECASFDVRSNDFVVRNTEPKTGALIATSTFTTTRCVECRWVSLGVPALPLSPA